MVFGARRIGFISEIMQMERWVDERYFEPFERVLIEFEQKHGVKLMEMDMTNFKGKRLRGELLVLLRDKAGLKYNEIAEIKIFSDLSFNSLGSIYRNMKNMK